MLDKKIKIISLLILSLLYTLNISLLRSDNLNECIKRAISKEISLNKILTLCRENINPLNVYSNNYEVNKRDQGSEYISTNKTDKIINELIEEGDLSKAGRLAIRQEEEKTKRIKARADAEALRAPQIIATQQESTNSNTDEEAWSSPVRSGRIFRMVRKEDSTTYRMKLSVQTITPLLLRRNSG